MKKIIIVLIVLGSLFAFGQQAGNVQNSNLLQKRIEDLKGTYELNYLANDRTLPMVPSNLADIIEKNRKQNEVNTIFINEKLQLIIYPVNRATPVKTN